MEAVYRIAVGTIIGASFMTLFSYLTTYSFDKLFKEPVLLNILLKRAKFVKGRKIHWITGWFIHYGIGVIFVIIYDLLWESTAIDPSYLSGAVFGFFSGLLGITGWSIIFNIHEHQPEIDFAKYYLHLILAHIIFGIGAAIGFLLLE